MIKDLIKLIEDECKNCIETGLYGTQEFHIEDVRRLEDKEESFNFLVTTFNRMRENSRTSSEMSLFDLMDLLGRLIGHKALSRSVEYINEKA